MIGCFCSQSRILALPWSHHRSSEHSIPSGKAEHEVLVPHSGWPVLSLQRHTRDLANNNNECAVCVLEGRHARGGPIGFLCDNAHQVGTPESRPFQNYSTTSSGLFQGTSVTLMPWLGCANMPARGATVVDKLDDWTTRCPGAPKMMHCKKGTTYTQLRADRST